MISRIAVISSVSRVSSFPVNRAWAASCAFLVATALAAVPYAGAEEPSCVTACEQKVDACAAQCEALADAVYRDPASLQQCQLGCARDLFTSCVQRCSETGEVSHDDYGFVAEDPDRVPAPPPDSPTP